MKNITLILASLLFFLSAPLEAQERARDTWSLKQHPSGTLMVDGVTYIPSQAQWESTDVLSLSKGEVLKPKELCTTRPAGLWKNTELCTWEKEIHDRGSYVEVRPGDRTEATALNARVFALIGIALGPTLLLVSRSRLCGASFSQGLGLALIIPLLLIIISSLTYTPLPFSRGNPQPGTSFTTDIAGFVATVATFVHISGLTLQVFKETKIPALVFLGCMVFITIFT